MSRKDISDYQVCLAHRKYKHDYQRGIDKWPYDYLNEWTGEPVKVCCRAMERTHRRGYLEWGVSLRTAWLTEEGVELLNAGGGGEDETTLWTSEQV